jgi:integrase
MGTITERKTVSGASRFTAQIRLKHGGTVTHTESKTFAKRKLAETWLARREAELTAGIPTKLAPVTFGQLIARYLNLSDDRNRDYGRGPDINHSKYELLYRILKDDLAHVDMLSYTSADILAYVRRRLQTISPATTIKEGSFIRQLLVTARTEWAIPIDLSPVDDALRYCRQNRLMQTNPHRERRLTADEERRLLDYFAERGGELPMHDLMLFAIHSTRRLGEICRIRWEDFNPDKKILLVRDVKNPRRKLGNHRWSRLTDTAIAVIQRQPRTEHNIFPYNDRSISRAFLRATRMLGIKNLRFHDLRHEGISRLFERGYAIHEVALFSLHQSWEQLRCYTHLRAEDIPDR